jgi:hypothetical protein
MLGASGATMFALTRLLLVLAGEIRMRFAACFLLLVGLTASTVAAAETCSGHFNACYHRCVAIGEGEDLGAECKRRCNRGVRQCMQTGCFRSLCGFSKT